MHQTGILCSRNVNSLNKNKKLEISNDAQKTRENIIQIIQNNNKNL